MDTQEKINALASRRAAIVESQEAARQRVQKFQQELAPAIYERDRLQGVCNHFEETDQPSPPYEQFAKAALAADRIAHNLLAAEAAAKQADEAALQNLGQINSEEIALRREIDVAAFRGAIACYEKAVQRSRLAFLADEVRRLADVAGIRLEERSPLLDDEHITIAGYPLNIRTHSSLAGDSPLAADEAGEIELATN